MADKEGTQFLVVFDITPANTDRLQSMMPQLQKLLQNISISPIQQFFRGRTADHFGYFIRSKLNANQILAIIEKPGTNDYWVTDNTFEPFITENDHIAVLQVGPGHATGKDGFARALIWMARY